MKGLFCSILIAGACMHTHAAPVNWELVDFRFSDGGTAYGSFTYDSETDQLSNIDIYTTKGSLLDGRHYISTAGAWGARPQDGILAFSNVAGPDFTGAGRFRIDVHDIDRINALPGTVLHQWLDVGAESFCIDHACSSAANEISHPGQSRDTIAGYLRATTPVPEPSTLVFSMLGLGVVATRVVSARKNRR